VICDACHENVAEMGYAYCPGCLEDGRKNRRAAYWAQRNADVTVAWVASEEVSGLQGQIVLAGECVQEGLPL
jgi:hypothetical protein